MRDDFNVILRWDRDDWVKIHFENIIDKFKNQFEMRRRNGDPDSGLPYDYCSIMHYKAKDFSKVIFIFFIYDQ